MNRTVEKGKTLVIDGPASVTLTSGRVEVFGSTMATTGKVVIRESKRLPFRVEETAAFDVSLGENAASEEVEGDTIPSSWNKASDELLSLEAEPITAMVLGTVDSGKSSFCTYLINKALREKQKVAILDGDLGQSDIGPPSTVAYSFVTKPLTDLFNLRAKNAFFIGETSPSGATGKVMEGLTSLKREISANNPELIVINTDGWVEGECAVSYKVQLVSELGPDVIFCIQQKDELTPLSNMIERFRKVLVESPSAIRQRDTERRRSLRELGYIKYLRNAKVLSLSLNWLKVEGNELFGIRKTRMSMSQSSKVYGLLGMRPLHLSEFGDKMYVVIGRRRWIESENIKKVEEFTKKKVIVTRKGDEEGLLTGMYDADRKFLGIGIVQEVDYVRKALKMYTPVSEEVSILSLGKVRLDKNMKEIPAVMEESQMDFAAFRKLF
jgi:polynucleotide 5'-hydroxyl-kinase GRC3/NOL9